MTTTIKQARGETNTIEVDYAGKAAPWDDLSLAVVMLTARKLVSDPTPAWATLGAVSGTKAYALVPLSAPAGIYAVTLSVFLSTGEIDHTPMTLRIERHAYQDGDAPVVPTTSVTSLLAEVAADAAAAQAAQTAAESARDIAVAAATDPLYTTATRPAAGVAWERRRIAVQDPGSDMEQHWCRQKADGSYEWIVVAF